MFIFLIPLCSDAPLEFLVHCGSPTVFFYVPTLIFPTCSHSRLPVSLPSMECLTPFQSYLSSQVQRWLIFSLCVVCFLLRILNFSASIKQVKYYLHNCNHAIMSIPSNWFVFRPWNFNSFICCMKTSHLPVLPRHIHFPYSPNFVSFF